MNKIFPASLDMLYDMLAFVSHFAKKNHFDSYQISKIELASEEALVNIISYGYPDGLGAIEIQCNSPSRSGIEIIIKDKGVPHNPLVVTPDTDIEPKVERSKIGGFGVQFMITLMDEVTYRREKDHNVLTLTKYLE